VIPANQAVCSETLKRAIRSIFQIMQFRLDDIPDNGIERLRIRRKGPETLCSRVFLDPFSCFNLTGGE